MKQKLIEIIREELSEIKERFADERRTEIMLGGSEMLEDEDLIPVENSIVTLTHQGILSVCLLIRIVVRNVAVVESKVWARMKMTLSSTY